MEWIHRQYLEREHDRQSRVDGGSVDEVDQQPEDKKLMFFVVNSYVRSAAR